jgi:single-stranded-DNA-specific exonuclease
MQKRWEFTEYDVSEATNLYQQLKVNPVFCQLLVQRGIYSFEQAKHFFRPQLTHLHDPFLMKDMEKAVRRIAQAIIKNEHILIYGDYDVDGTTSVALMYTFLSGLHKNIDFYIPDRYKEGYGISLKGVEYAQQNECTLIIALDCGIKAHEAVNFGNSKNIDFIICDHHLPDPELPEAYAILNPRQSDCSYPFRELSGCAIGFKLAEAFVQLYDLSFEDVVEPLLDLVAVSLACDFVPLTGENRVLAYFGLQRLNQKPRTGLKILMGMLKSCDNYSVRDLVFGIGPVINAAGRIGHASEAVDLLISVDENIANDVAVSLIAKNQQRRDIEHDIVLQAKRLVEDDVAFAQKNAVVLFNDQWHKGVVGIVASKMVNEYHKPAIIFTLSNGKIVGSARSVSGFNIYKSIQECDDLLLSYGGHKFAAGLSLNREDLNEFIQRFQDVVALSITERQLLPVQHFDAEINMNQINREFWNLLEQFSPFGPQNMRPVFISKHLRDTGYSKLVKNEHIKLVIHQDSCKPVEGIAFNMGHHMNKLAGKKPFEACFVLEENTFKGKSRLQMNVKDLRFPG